MSGLHVLRIAAILCLAHGTGGQTDGLDDGKRVPDRQPPKRLDKPKGMLNAANSAFCALPCASYHSGASAAMPLVCQYQASGVGTLTQIAEQGARCFPPFNCGSDWNVCFQNSTATVAPRSPFAACDEIEQLVAGGTSGEEAEAPPGGWRPTSTGWMKGRGSITCGWGSTYDGVEPDGAADSSWRNQMLYRGRRVKNGVDDEIECCRFAAQFENAPLSEGGAAIRFGLVNGRCVVDRERMMTGNLDHGSGRGAYALERCGLPNTRTYWRHAAGSADGSSLKTGGRCVQQGGFTKVQSVARGALVPSGRLPEVDMRELPNDGCDGDANKCRRAIRYNTINDAEACCDACRNVRWAGDTGGDGDVVANPCLAWQIVDGKCRILRKEWFDRYASPGLGRHAPGDAPMTVPEVIASCAGFADAQKCERADDSHGHWADCCDASSGEACNSIGDECSYYSFMHFRANASADDGGSGANATYRKLLTVGVPYDAIPDEGYNLTFNFSVLTSRSRLSELLANGTDGVKLAREKFKRPKPGYKAASSPGKAPDGEEPGGKGGDAPSGGGSGAAPGPRPLALGEGKTVGDDNCAVVEILSPLALDAQLSTASATVFDEGSPYASQPVCRSEPVCDSDGEIVLTCAKGAVQAAVDEVRERRRRLFIFGSSSAADSDSLSATDELVLSFNAQGSGYDTVDFEGDLESVAVEAGLLLPPPSPPPASPPPPVQVQFVASGTPEDFDEVKRSAILAALAAAAGVPSTAGASLEITPGSVNIIATFPVASSGAAASVVSLLTAAMSTAAAATSLLANAGVVGVTVESAPVVAVFYPPSPPPPLPPSDANCPTGWVGSPAGVSWGPQCYRLSDNRTTHSGCVDACGSGAGLACVTDAQENAWLASSVVGAAAPPGGTMLAWLGVYQWPADRGPSDGWQQCTNGHALTFSAWATGQPNDGVGFEDCAVLDPSGGWTDVPCSTTPAPPFSPLPCLCALGGNWSTSYLNRAPVLHSARDTWWSATTRARALRNWGYVAFLAVCPILIFSLWRGFCCLMRLQARNDAVPSASSSKGDSGNTMVVQMIGDARHKGALLRLRVSGILLQCGWVLFVGGLAPNVGTLWSAAAFVPPTAVWGAASLSVPGFVLMVLAILPTDSQVISGLCNLFCLLMAGGAIASGYNAANHAQSLGKRGIDLHHDAIATSLTAAQATNALLFVAGALCLLPTLLVEQLCATKDNTRQPATKGERPHALGANRSSAPAPHTLGARRSSLLGGKSHALSHALQLDSVCGRFKILPPRAKLRRLWLVLRATTTGTGVVWLVCQCVVPAVLRGASVGLVGDVAFGASLCICGALLTRGVRGAVIRSLGNLGSRGATEHQQASTIASMVGGLSPVRALEAGMSRFRVLPLADLVVNDLLTSSDTGLFSKTRCVALGECDAFISHSWRDDGNVKFERIGAWAASKQKGSSDSGGSPLNCWLDKACIDQENIEANLAVLPVFLSGCRELLVLDGPTYTSRLWYATAPFEAAPLAPAPPPKLASWEREWLPAHSSERISSRRCVIEVYTFVKMGGTRQRIVVQRLSPTVDGTRAKRFHAGHADCFKREDKERLLGIVEAGFGTLAPFNRIMSSVLGAVSSTDEAAGKWKKLAVSALASGARRSKKTNHKQVGTITV